MGKLVVAASVEAAVFSMESMLQGDPAYGPGFQAGPEVPTDQLLIALAEVMQKRVDPSFVFDEETNSVTYPGGATPPHTDNPISRHNRGIAVHDNLTGTGIVRLRLMLPGVRYRPGSSDEQFAGDELEGDIAPDVKTVFSEGIVSLDGLVTIGASLHYYDTTSKEPRVWRRHTYSGDQL
jgi:hypothetical protein